MKHEEHQEPHWFPSKGDGSTSGSKTLGDGAQLAGHHLSIETEEHSARCRRERNHEKHAEPNGPSPVWNWHLILGTRHRNGGSAAVGCV